MVNITDAKHQIFRQACKGKERNVLMEAMADWKVRCRCSCGACQTLLRTALGVTAAMMAV